MGILQNVKICATAGRMSTRSGKKDYTNENDGSEQAPQILGLCLSLQALCRARLYFPGVCGIASHSRHSVAPECIAGLQWTWILGFHVYTLRLSAPGLALACHARTALALSRGMRVDTHVMIGATSAQSKITRRVRVTPTEYTFNFSLWCTLPTTTT
jgi:hypothetical protein